VYYVGETGRSFERRLSEHARDYLGGFYRVYDPEQFATGRKALVWGGLTAKSRTNLMEEFLSRQEELTQTIRQLLSKMTLHCFVFEGSDRMRHRIEASIAKHLLAQGGVIGQFQEDDVRYQPRRKDEEPVIVNIDGESPIAGPP